MQGFTQKVYRIDFWSDDLFAPTSRLTTLCLVVMYATTNDWEIHQIDIKLAYLYSELIDDEVIWVKPPPGNLIDGIRPGEVL